MAFAGVLKGQIDINTNMNPAISEPLDIRLNQLNLSDTVNITYPPLNQLVWFVDVQQYWRYTGSFWKQFIVQSGAGGIETVIGLNGLLGYQGQASILNVLSESYVHNDSTRYWEGALFSHLVGSNANDNGGTLYRAVDDRRWQRAFDGMNYNPEFWKQGYVRGTGASNIPIHYDGERVTAAAEMAIAFNGNVILPGKTFYDVYYAIRSIGGVQFLGTKGSEIKRGDAIIKTFTTAPVAGNDTIFVNNTTGFYEGMRFVVKTRHRKKASQYSAELKIGSVGSDWIELDGGTFPSTTRTGISKTWNIGDSILTVCDIFGGHPNNTITNKSTEVGVFKNFTINGNMANNSEVVIWNSNNMSTVNQWFTYYENMIFTGSTAQSMAINSATFLNCYWYEMAGGGFHANSTFSDRFGSIEVIGGGCQNVNLWHTDSLEHENSFFNFSVNASRFTVRGGIWIGRTDGDLSDMQSSLFSAGGDDFEFRAFGVRAENFNGIITIVGGGGVTYDEANGYYIGHSYFRNCGDVVIYRSIANTPDDAIKKVTFEHNSFYNTKFAVQDVNGFNFLYNDCIVLRDSVFTGFTGSAGAGIFTDWKAHMVTKDCRDVTITGNTFAGGEVADPNLIRGLLLDVNPVLDTSGFETITSNYDVSNNTVFGHENSIMFNYVPDIIVDYRRNDITVSENKIYHRIGTEGCGIEVPPGVKAYRNHIWFSSPGTASRTAALIVTGTNSEIYKDDVQGGFAHGNFVYALQGETAIRVGWTSSNGEYNCDVQENYFTGNITDYTAGESTVMFNNPLSYNGRPEAAYWNVHKEIYLNR